MSGGAILHVLSSLDPAAGGVAQAVRLFAGELQECGRPNEIVTVDPPDAAWVESLQSVPIHALGPGRYGWAYSNRLLPWLRENLGRFESVIVHGLWLYPSYAACKALQGVAMPRLFVMPHGMLDPYFQQAPERRLKALRNTVYWSIIENRVVESAAGLLFTCDEEMRLAREPFRPYKPKREAVVGLGIEEPPGQTAEMREAFTRRCPGWGGGDYLLFLGRIHRKKGIDLLLRAYAKLHSRPGHKPSDIPLLIIAGPCNDPDYLRDLETICKESGLPWTAESSGESGPLKTAACPAGDGAAPTVHFVGMLSGDAKWGAIYGCNAFVLTSHQENFGIAVAEALACGKPVLLSDKVNIWREIKEAEAGLVAPDTSVGCEELLGRWLDLGQKDRDSFGENGRRLFAARYRSSAAASALVVAIDAG